MPLKRVGYVVFDDSLTEALLFLKDRVLHGPPRALRACDYPTYHLFTDASYEQDQPAGMGGILYSQSGLLLRWFSERASLEVLDAINADGKAGLIYGAGGLCRSARTATAVPGPERLWTLSATAIMTRHWLPSLGVHPIPL